MVACDVKTFPTNVVPHIFLLQDNVPLKYLDACAVAAQGDSLTKWLQRLRKGGQMGTMALLQPPVLLTSVKPGGRLAKRLVL